MAAGPNTGTVMPDVERNSLVVSHLTSKVGIEAVRVYFNRIVHPDNLAKFLNSKKNKIQRLLYQHRTGQSQYDVLFPPIAARVTSSDFDITLMTCLIRNTFKNATPPTTGWDALPNSADLTEEADVVRIKYYRNTFVAHHSLYQLSNAEYNKAATDLKYAISRLSNTSLDAEAENILDMKIVPSQYLDVIPRHIREQNTVITDTWRAQRHSCVETRAYRQVRSNVQKHTFTTISGNSGSGKSAIAHGIALELKEDGYTIVPIKTVDEIRTYSDLKSKHLYVIDDPVGTVSVDEVSLAGFQLYNQLITDILKDSQIKVVITCRRAIMNDKRVRKSNTMLCKSIVDINNSDLRLTTKEKEDIFDHYTEHVDKELLNKSKRSIINLDVDNFPLLCRLFSCNKNFQKLGKTFFEDIFKHLIEELEVVQSQDKIQFCCLLLCLFYNNDFDVKLLDLFSDIGEENKSKLNQIIAASGLSNNISLYEIQIAMEGLVDVYFIQEGTHFRFLHDAIYEFVSFVFGSRYPNETLKVCSSSFIRERVRLSSNDQNFIVLESKYYQSLAERLFQELERGNFFDVFLCPFIKALQKELIQCFRNKHSKEICTMLESKINSDILQKHITRDKKHISWQWYFLDILSSNNTKLIHWILEMDLMELFTFVYKQYTNFRNRQTDHLNLIPIACLSGNIRITKLLLTDVDNSDIFDTWDASYDTKLSTLHMAVFSSNPIMVRYIIINKIHTHIQTEQGRTPLYIGAALGFTSICKVLIEKGADVNITDNDGRTPLYTASENGHIDMVKVLIDSGADVNLADKDRWTPLYTACLSGHIDIVKVFVDSGANFNMVDNGGWTPLYTASFNSKVFGINIADNAGNTPLYTESEISHIDIVKVLVDRGADINRAANNGSTPLYTASIGGHIGMVKVLLDIGADVNMADNVERTPLYRASLNGHIDVVKVLIDSGADVNMADNDGRTPLYTASENGHIDVVNVFLDIGADVNMADNGGRTPLYRASLNGHINIVNVLVDSGANVNLTYNEGRSPLFRASIYDHIDMIKVLVDSGANVNLADNEGRSPLIRASIYDHTDMVKVLVDSGANVNMVDKYGDTPLHAASKNDHIDMVKVLVDSGANVNKIDKYGDTPLHAASKNNHIDMVKFLVDIGANVNMIDNYGDTPLHAASKNDHIDMVKALVDSSADVNMVDKYGDTPLHAASKNDHIAMVKVLIDSGANVNKIDKYGDMPLHAAFKNDHIDMVKVLVDSGADVNMVDIKGFTPLFTAYINGHIDMVRVLVDKGADINIDNKYGDTPLYIASSKGHINIVKVLVNRGADINMADKYGRTPLLIASNNGHIAIVKVLNNKAAGVTKAK